MGTTVNSTGVTFGDGTSQNTAASGGGIDATESFIRDTEGSGNLDVPDGCDHVLVRFALSGGGGGGAGGNQNGSTNNSNYPTKQIGLGGAGGGAGAALKDAIYSVTAGETLAWAVGGGGTGGTAGTPGNGDGIASPLSNSGGTGGTTSLKRGNTEIFTVVGGQGGTSGNNTGNTNNVNTSANTEGFGRKGGIGSATDEIGSRDYTNNWNTGDFSNVSIYQHSGSTGGDGGNRGNNYNSGKGGQGGSISSSGVGIAYSGSLTPGAYIIANAGESMNVPLKDGVPSRTPYSGGGSGGTGGSHPQNGLTQYLAGDGGDGAGGYMELQFIKKIN